MKKQVVTLTVTYDEDETHAGSAIEAISHQLYNEEGIVKWEWIVESDEVVEVDENV